MNKNAQILELLVDEDFGYNTKEQSRWGKSVEHDSLVVDKEKGIFYWNSESVVGDPLVYLTKVRLMTFEDAKKYLEKFEYTGTHVYTINSRNTGKDIVVYPKLVDVFFDIGKSKDNRDYFHRRGLTDNIIDTFQLGFYNGYNMIPFFENGTFRNFQMRRDMPTKRIKSYYSDIGPLMFNSDILNIVDEVFYVEGPIDAISMVQNGLPAISTNCGGGYDNEWYSKFIRQKIIYIIFDNDTAGIKEAKRLAKFLGQTRCVIYTFTDFEEDRYDPVDFFMDGYSKEDLLKRINKYGKRYYEF